MSQMNVSALAPSAIRFPDPPIGRPIIPDGAVIEPETLPPTGPPGYEGEWNPAGDPPVTGTPVPGLSPDMAGKLKLMLAIARSLSPAVTDAGMGGQVSARELADALRGLANLLDPPVAHGPAPGPYVPTHRFPGGPIERYPGNGYVTRPMPGDSEEYALAARRNG